MARTANTKAAAPAKTQKAAPAKGAKASPAKGGKAAKAAAPAAPTKQAKAAKTEKVAPAKAAKGAKGAKEVAKGAKGAKNAKGEKKAPARPQKTAEQLQEGRENALALLKNKTIIPACRVKNHLLEYLNPEVIRAESDFTSKNEKVLHDEKLSKLDEATVTSYNEVLRFSPTFKEGSNAEQKAKQAEKQRVSHNKEVQSKAASDKMFKLYAQQYKVKQELKQIRSEKIHVGQSTYHGIAGLSKNIVRDILTHGCEMVISSNKKRVELKYVLAQGIEKVNTYALFGLTNTFKDAYAKCLRDQKEQTENTENADAETDEEEEHAEASQEETTTTLRNFRGYVHQVGRALTASDERFNRVTMTRETVEFCSNVLVDIIKNLANALRELLTLRKAKTIKYETVRIAVSTIMKFHSQDTERILAEMDNSVQSYVDGKARAAEEKKNGTKAAAPKKGGKKPKAAAEAAPAAEAAEESSSESSSAESDADEEESSSASSS